MNVQFIPIPPDTTSSLRQDLLEKTEPLGLSGNLDSCVAWGGVLEGSFPDTPEVMDFLKSMKRICEVHIVL